MATLTNGLRSAMADAMNTRINTGAGTANIVFQTSADATLATLALSNPFAPAAVNGVLTANTITAANASAAGTAAKARITNRGGTDEITGITVGTSGQEINFSSVTWAVGDSISVTSLTLTVQAATV